MLQSYSLSTLTRKVYIPPSQQHDSSFSINHLSSYTGPAGILSSDLQLAKMDEEEVIFYDTHQGWEEPPGCKRTTAPAGETCGICQEEFTDPYSPLCKHTFCKRCLMKWYNETMREQPVTCPICRTQIFDSKDGVPGNILCYTQVPVVIRRSRLLHGGFTCSDHDQFREICTDNQQWRSDIVHAVDFLLSDQGWGQKCTPCRFERKKAVRDAVIIGNLARELYLLFLKPHQHSEPNFVPLCNVMIQGCVDFICLQPQMTLLDSCIQRSLVDAMKDAVSQLDQEHRTLKCKGTRRAMDDFVHSVAHYVTFRGCVRSLKDWACEAAAEPEVFV